MNDALRKLWEVKLKELKEMGETEAPRLFDDGDEEDQTVSGQVNGFSDASKKGNGVCIYVRSVFKWRNVHVRLLTSKSRIAPLKEITIPRLELLGNLLVTCLIRAVKTTAEKKLSLRKKFIGQTLRFH